MFVEQVLRQEQYTSAQRRLQYPSADPGSCVGARPLVTLTSTFFQHVERAKVSGTRSPWGSLPGSAPSTGRARRPFLSSLFMADS